MNYVEGRKLKPLLFLASSMIVWSCLTPQGAGEELVLLKEFVNGINFWQNNSNTRQRLVEANGSIFFFADPGWYNSAIFTYEERPSLWKTDGTPEGTVVVKENILAYAPAASQEEHARRSGLARVEEMCSVNGIFFFVVRRDTYDAEDNIVEGRSELWKSDGTAAGTVIVKYPAHARWSPRNLTDVNGILYFTAWDSMHGRELWRSDGTEMNTSLVADINPGEDDSGVPRDSDPRHLINASGTLFFSADDGVHGHELWKWQPRGGGGFSGVTEMVKNIQTSTWDLPSFPEYFLYVRNDLNAIMGNLYFSTGLRLWITDGTEQGTVEITPASFYGDLKAVASRVFRTWPGVFTELNGWVYYAKNDGITGFELWKSDGNGELLVKDIFPGHSWSNPLGSVNGRASEFLKVNDKIYFIADGGTGQRIWESDGTESGTVPAFPSLWGRELDYAAMDGSIFVTTDDEIWVRRSLHLKITPATPQVNAGETIVLAAVVSGARTNTVFNSYVWQHKPPGANAFVTIADSDIYYTDFTTSTLRVRNVRPEMSGTQFRCLASLSNPDTQLQAEPVTLTVIARPASLNVSLTDGTFRWTVSGGAGTVYKLQASTNLVEWSEVSVTESSGEAVELSDSDIAYAQRFYRVVAE